MLEGFGIGLSCAILFCLLLGFSYNVGSTIKRDSICLENKYYQPQIKIRQCEDVK